MGEGFEVDTAALRRAATSFETAADDLTRQRRLATSAPDAGRSTTEVGDAIEALAGVVDELGRAADHYAGGLRDSADAYDVADENGRRAVDRWPGP